MKMKFKLFILLFFFFLSWYTMKRCLILFIWNHLELDFCVYSLEISLQKRSDGPLWSEVVLGDRRGEYLVNDEQKSQLQQKLSYLTAEDLVSFFH